MKKKFFNQSGITLIALVITIIVLLILAGVTIATLTGDNGILTRAQDAKEQTEEAALEEKIRLLAAETTINQYTNQSEEKTAQELQDELNNNGENVLVIQWDKYIIFDLNQNKEYRVMSDGTTEYWGESTMGQTLLNTKTANVDQLEQDSSTSNLIGIDDDGNTVNMLLWEHTLIEDGNLGKIGTYGLNDKNALDGTGTLGRSAGYLGNYTDDGRIIGTVPAYISEDGGNNYISVTSMVHTFYDCDDLIIAPEIANTVTNMYVTFYQASNLTTAPTNIPDSVTNLSYTFLNCEKLVTIPELGNNIQDMTASFRDTAISNFDKKIPDSVTNMSNTFSECKNLIEFNISIPDNVTNLYGTFASCINLTEFNIPLPDKVTDITSMFYECTNLISFNSEIPNSVEKMQYTFTDCTSLVKGPDTIPENVTNLLQCFMRCYKLEGRMTINANIGEDIVFEWNNNEYKGYHQTFLDAGTDGNGIIISMESTCRSEVLITGYLQIVD